jgi:anaerobic selenocysteine-containing dehydrogenase
VMGSSGVVSAPNAGRIEHRLAALDFLMVADFFLSETARLADVVLPTTQWAEEEGTMINLEGRVLLRRLAVEAPVGVRTDLEIISALAERLGCPDGFPSQSRKVFDELRRASYGAAADYSGKNFWRGWGLLALPRRGRPRPATDVSRPFRHARRSCAVSSGRVSPAGRSAGYRVSDVSHHRARDGALPVRQSDPPGQDVTRF